MRRVLSLIICFSILLSQSGCSKSPRLDLASFEKYALSDLQIEKKDISAQDPNAYYDLDSSIDNTDASQLKRDHYVQVYSKDSGDVISNMYIVYTDYQLEEDARKYYDELVKQEKEMLASSSDTHNIDEGKDYFLVLTSSDNMNFRFECLYIQKDVILFAAIILATSDITKLNVEWLKKVESLFDDLHLRQPLDLSPDISGLLKK